MPDLHTLPDGWRPETAVRDDGSDDLAIQRFKLRDLAEGWPMYRDSCEWENLESMLAPDAYIYTTWTGKTFYQDFIMASKAGMDKGAFIMHRCLGASTDINPEATRAVTKLEAIIIQRFVLDGCEVDADADCRFSFFFEKGTDQITDLPKGEWRARYVRHWYEKDRLIPVNPTKVPKLDETLLEKYPPVTEATMNLKVITDLPGHRREGESLNGKAHDALYLNCKTWVEGGSIEF